MLFISSSIKIDLKAKLASESDFIVTKLRSGKSVDLPSSWIKEIEDIRGVSRVGGRVYGRYMLKGGDGISGFWV